MTYFYQNKEEQINLSGKRVTDNITLLNFAISQNLSIADIYIDAINITEDGILGLGYSKSSFVYDLYKQKFILSPIYSIQETESSTTLLVFDTPNFESLNLHVKASLSLSYINCSALFSYDNYTFEDHPLGFSLLSSHITGPSQILQHFFNSLI